jgi:aminoglycoside/choline kinase family phosphotransferase
MDTGEREFLKEHFLAHYNYRNCKREKLEVDASFRTYERLYIDSNQTKILMDCPPGKENLELFIKASNWLRSQGFSAPEIFEHDLRLGIGIVEDFGVNKFSTILTGRSPLSQDLDAEMIYEKAIDVLIKLSSIVSQEAVFPYYDDEIYIREALKFTKWYVRTVNGEELKSKQIEDYRIIWKHLLPYTRFIPESVVLRDYHVENLLWLEDRMGIRKVGLIDFQDALIGSPAYDLVSLLEDARIDVPQDITNKMIAKYLAARPEISRKDFLAAYAILGVQRNLKIIGVFAKKMVRYKNNNYLKYLPRVWRNLEEGLRHPLLAPMKNWLDKIISPDVRKAQGGLASNEKKLFV